MTRQPTMTHTMHRTHPLWTAAFALTALLAAPAQAQTVLKFDDAVARAPGASTDREEAQADLSAASARRSQAHTGFGPRVSADFTEARFDKTVALPFGTETFTIRPDKMREGALQVTQPLFGLYTAFEASRAAKVLEDASSAAVDEASTAAMFDTAAAYLSAQEADELVRLAQASIQAADGQMHDAQALSKSGRIIRSDLLKISIAAQDAKAQLARATATQKKARAKLLQMVGLPPESQITLEPLPQATKVASLAPTVTAVTDETLAKTRVDVRRAALDVEAAGYQQRLARWRFAPDVNAFVKWERIYSEPPFGNPPFTRSYGIAANWEIWDGGSRLYATREAAAHTQKSEAALRESKEKARLELDSLTADVTAAKESLFAAQGAVDQAEEAYRLDKARFGGGLVTATDLLLSEATRTRARATFVTTLTQMNRLALSLQRASGASKPQQPTR